MLKSQEELSALCEELRSKGKTIVFTNGCFDIIHAGHCSYLAEARKDGDLLIIGLNSDDSVTRLKGPGRPLNSESDRAYVLSSLKSVDYVTIFDEDTPYNLIKKIKPDVLVKGGDYSFDTIVGADFVTERGGKVIVIPLTEGLSTTKIIDKLKAL